MITKLAVKFWHRVAKDPELLTRAIKNMVGVKDSIMENSGGAYMAARIMRKIESDPALGKKFFREMSQYSHDALQNVPVTDKLKRWTYIKSNKGTHGRLLIPSKTVEHYKDIINSIDSSGISGMAKGMLEDIKSNTGKALNFIDGSASKVDRATATNIGTFKVLSGKKVPFYHMTDRDSAKAIISANKGKAVVSSPSSIAQAASFSNVPLDKNLFAYPKRNNLIKNHKDSVFLRGEVPLREVLFAPETTKSMYNKNTMPEMIINQQALRKAKLLTGNFGGK